jgi:hypothetical protein
MIAYLIDKIDKIKSWLHQYKWQVGKLVIHRYGIDYAEYKTGIFHWAIWWGAYKPLGIKPCLFLYLCIIWHDHVLFRWSGRMLYR